jgi:hypothetical protein
LARYIAISPIGLPGGTKCKTGQTIADSSGAAIAGDIVWPGASTNPSPAALRPLDASASTLMGLPIWTGGNLIAIGLGAGLDAGI